MALRVKKKNLYKWIEASAKAYISKSFLNAIVLHISPLISYVHTGGQKYSKRGKNSLKINHEIFWNLENTIIRNRNMENSPDCFWNLLGLKFVPKWRWMTCLPCQKFLPDATVGIQTIHWLHLWKMWKYSGDFQRSSCRALCSWIDRRHKFQATPSPGRSGKESSNPHLSTTNRWTQRQKDVNILDITALLFLHTC